MASGFQKHQEVRLEIFARVLEIQPPETTLMVLLGPSHSFCIHPAVSQMLWGKISLYSSNQAHGFLVLSLAWVCSRFHHAMELSWVQRGLQLLRLQKHDF